MIWVPVFHPELLMNWRISPIGLLTRQWIVVGGLLGILLLAVRSGHQGNDRFKWVTFVLMLFLGFSTFGVATLTHWIWSGWVMHAAKNQISPKPGEGLWWSFAEKHWSPSILEAMHDTDSTLLRLALNAQVIWESDVTSELHLAGQWMAVTTLERDQTMRSTFDEFADALEIKRQWLNGERSEEDLLSKIKELEQIILRKVGWQSNWCTGINSAIHLKRVFQLALFDNLTMRELREMKADQQLHACCLARCRSLECDLSEATMKENLSESQQGEYRVRGISCPGVENDDPEKTPDFDEVAEQVAIKQEQYLRRLFLLRLAGQKRSQETDLLEIPKEEWKKMAESLSKSNPSAATAFELAGLFD